MVSSMRSPPAIAVDAAIGVTAAGALLVAAWLASEPIGGRPGDGNGHGAIAVALAAGFAAVLTLRRRYPVGVLAAANAGTLAWFALGYPGFLAFLAPLIALFTLTAQRGWRWGLAGGLATGTCMAVVGFAYDKVPDPNGEGALVAYAVGAAVHYRRQLVAAAAGRLAREAQAREEQARRHAVEQRLRVARDVHDVVGHAMATVSVQAGVAIHVFEKQPAQALTALTAIKKITDEGLADVRAIIATLQDDDAPQPLGPAAGLDRLDSLLEATRTAGPDVEFVVRGTRRPLPVPVDLAAYRIIQESLTNVIRHAGARAVRLDLDYRPDSLGIHIRDDGARPPGTGADTGTGTADGHGIRGMRERAHALSGQLTTRAWPDGFEVTCVLPTHDSGTHAP